VLPLLPVPLALAQPAVGLPNARGLEVFMCGGLDRLIGFRHLADVWRSWIGEYQRKHLHGLAQT
jgi:hypothetical protein